MYLVSLHINHMVSFCPKYPVQNKLQSGPDYMLKVKSSVIRDYYVCLLNTYSVKEYVFIKEKEYLCFHYQLAVFIHVCGYFHCFPITLPLKSKNGQCILIYFFVVCLRHSAKCFEEVVKKIAGCVYSVPCA